MLVLPHTSDRTPDRCGGETNRVRSIGEVLTCVLSRYQITIEPATEAAPRWAEASLGDEEGSGTLTASSESAVLCGG